MARTVISVDGDILCWWEEFIIIRWRKNYLHARPLATITEGFPIFIISSWQEHRSNEQQQTTQTIMMWSDEGRETEKRDAKWTKMEIRHWTRKWTWSKREAQWCLLFGDAPTENDDDDDDDVAMVAAMALTTTMRLSGIIDFFFHSYFVCICIFTVNNETMCTRFSNRFKWEIYIYICCYHLVIFWSFVHWNLSIGAW